MTILHEEVEEENIKTSVVNFGSNFIDRNKRVNLNKIEFSHKQSDKQVSAQKRRKDIEKSKI